MKTERMLRDSLRYAADMMADVEGTVTIDQAIRRGRKRRTVGKATAAFAVTLVAMGVAASFSLIYRSFVAAPPPSAVPVEGRSGRGTYVLSVVDLQFPYLVGAGDAPDPSRAGVVLSARWSTDRFPGKATCEVLLLDAEGGAVGAIEFDAAYASNPSRPPDLPVPVTGAPVAAEGRCGPGSYPVGPGYLIDDIEVRAAPGAESSEVTFRAGWAQSVDPSWRRCQLAAVLDDGQTLTQRFNLSVPDGEQVSQGIPVASARIADVTVSCAELV